MIETEIKFKLDNPNAIRKKLKEAKAILEGSFFQKNFVFDTPDKKLKRKGGRLRLRIEGKKAMLTLKGKKMKSRFKKRPEINLPVEDAKTALELLKELGFKKEWTYEKKIKYFRLGKAIVTIDQMPVVGCFLEIEAEPKQIEKTAKLLGLNLKDGIKEGYVSLFKEFKKKGILKKKNWVFG